MKIVISRLIRFVMLFGLLAFAVSCFSGSFSNRKYTKGHFNDRVKLSISQKNIDPTEKFQESTDKEYFVLQANKNTIDESLKNVSHCKLNISTVDSPDKKPLLKQKINRFKEVITSKTSPLSSNKLKDANYFKEKNQQNISQRAYFDTEIVGAVLFLGGILMLLIVAIIGLLGGIEGGCLLVAIGFIMMSVGGIMLFAID